MNWWTEERVAELKRMVAEGLSSGDIRSRLGAASRNMIIGKARRLGLTLHGRLGATPGRRAHRAVVKAAPTPKQAPTGKPVPLIEAKPNVCRYPLWGDDGNPDFLVCGAPGHPWCQKHRARVYTQRPLRERRIALSGAGSDVA